MPRCEKPRSVSRSWRRRIGAQFLEAQLLDLLLENLARFELHHSPLGNDHLGLGLVRIAAHPRFAHLDLENAEVTQLDVSAGGQCIVQKN